jgi:hypothetical protein
MHTVALNVAGVPAAARKTKQENYYRHEKL